MRKKYIWLAVTRDEYELPVYIADTASELAEKCGVNVNAVYSAIIHAKERNYRCRYVKVEVD